MTYDIAQMLALDALWTLTTVCEQVSGEQLDRPTPCAGWDLRALLEHLTGQHHGIAAALSGSGRDLADWRPRPIGELTESIHDVRLALLSTTRETAWMPGLDPAAPLPAPTVLRAHLVDTVTHAWDVAATIGVPVEFSPPTLAEAYGVARRIPDGPERDRPGAAFAHALPGGTEPTLAGFLALLGRDINWSPLPAFPG